MAPRAARLSNRWGKDRRREGQTGTAEILLMAQMQFVESYKFWDVVVLWSRERAEDETSVARALARGVIVEALRIESADPCWFLAGQSPSGYPYIGYCAIPTTPPVQLRIEALEHLLAVTRQAASPSHEFLRHEFLFRNDFKVWIKSTGRTLPTFWFTDIERAIEA